jgi:hypothetical protein
MTVSDFFLKIQASKKYRATIITVLLVLWTLLTPCLYRKGGVPGNFPIAIVIFMILISFLIVSKFNSIQSKTITIVAFIFAFISLFITTILLGPGVVEFLYGDKTWFLWEMQPRIIINAIYYGLNAMILVLLSKLYFQLQEIKNHNHTK